MLKHLIIYTWLLCLIMSGCVADEHKTEQKAGGNEVMKNQGNSPAKKSAAPATFVIGKGRVGDIRVGIPITEMQELVAEHFTTTDTLLQLEGENFVAYHLRPEGSRAGLIVEQLCEPVCRVWRISVSSPEFKTEKGIGVGATFGEVLQQYEIDYVSMGDAGLVAVSERNSISFTLDSTAIPPDQLKNPEPADIPANTPVKRIFTY